jgi:hypothetical protein
MAQINPAEHDARQAEAMAERAKVQHDIERVAARMHRMAGDRYGYRGRTQVWTMSDASVLAQLRERADDGDTLDVTAGAKPSQLLAQYTELWRQLGHISGDIIAMDAEWREHGWTRWIECLNSDGHIHSWFGCSTLRPATQLNWRTDLSGAVLDDAIKDFGPRLCSVCFPGAPAEQCQKKSDIDRAARTAAKRAREEAKFVKGLRPGEQFRDARGDRVTTVAACKQVLRDAIDAEHYYPKSYAEDQARYDEVCATARRVLLGRGVTDEEIDRIEIATRKRIARDDARFSGR